MDEEAGDDMWPFERGPKPVVDPTEGDPTARLLVDAGANGDWETVRDILRATTDPDDRAFYVDMSVPDQGPEPAWLDTWAAAEPRAALPLVLRGRHGINWAWEARGSAAASTVTDQGWRLFAKRLKAAEDCLDDATARDPDDPTPWSLLVTSARGRGLPAPEANRRFKELTARHRWHVRGHQTMLQYRCAKWYGSHDEMHRFADQTVAEMPAGSLLGGLVPSAHFEHRCRLDGAQRTAFDQNPAVLASLHHAADRSVRHPAYVRRLGWSGPEGVFALMFLRCGDGRAAVERFDAIGPYVADHPFGYWAIPSPVFHFKRYRRRARAVARRR